MPVQVSNRSAASEQSGEGGVEPAGPGRHHQVGLERQDLLGRDVEVLVHLQAAGRRRLDLLDHHRVVRDAVALGIGRDPVLQAEQDEALHLPHRRAVEEQHLLRGLGQGDLHAAVVDRRSHRGRGGATARSDGDGDGGGGGGGGGKQAATSGSRRRRTGRNMTSFRRDVTTGPQHRVTTQNSGIRRVGTQDVGHVSSTGPSASARSL